MIPTNYSSPSQHLVPSLAAAEGARATEAGSALEASAEVLSRDSESAIDLTKLPLQVLNYIDVLGKERYLDYDVKTHKHSHSVTFERTGTFSSRCARIDISLFRESTNLAKAFYIVSNILNDSHISTFRSLKISQTSAFEDSTGKEMVVYINKEEQRKELWESSILPQILARFQEEEVKADLPSQGVIEIPGGRGFLFTRSAYNSFGNYLPAHWLNYYGFSTFECATTSPTDFSITLSLEEGAKSEEAKKTLEAKNPYFHDVPEEKIAVLNDFFSSTLDSNVFFQLVTGVDPSYLDDPEGKIIPFLNRYGNDFGNFYHDRTLKALQRAKLKPEIFTPLFEISSQVSAKMRLYYGVETAIGQIYPALYQHFIKYPDIPPFETLYDSRWKEIVKSIVLCTLRDGSAKPAEPISCDEGLLDHLIQTAIEESTRK